MNCERIQERFLDLASLSAAEAAEVKAHLQHCPTCQREFADLQDTLRRLDAFPVERPSPRLRANFYTMLDSVQRPTATAAPRRPASGRAKMHWYDFAHVSPLWQMAAAVVLLVSGAVLGAAFMTLKNAGPTKELAQTQQQLAELRTKIDSMNQLVSYSLAQREPAQTRLQQVVAKAGRDDDLAITQLLSALAFDPSTNVRLSALESLYARANERVVRQGVLAALPREASPLVQVAMIDFLASVREPEAQPIFLELTRTPRTNESVRTAAQRALAQF